MKNIILIIYVSIFISCTKEKNDYVEKFEENLVNKSNLNSKLEWKHLKNNLWINKKGEIGVKYSFFYDKQYFDYIKEIEIDKLEFIPLAKVIDTSSFVKLSNKHYKDSNNVYFINDEIYYWERIEINKKADVCSFESINDFYSKDNSNIYFGSEILKEVDYKTFSVISSYGLAKDKNGFIANGVRDKNEIKKVKKIMSQMETINLKGNNK